MAGGSPVLQGLPRGKGESLPFPSFQQCFLSYFLIPLPDLQALLWPGTDQSAVWASKPEAAQGQPNQGAEAWTGTFLGL